jgi:hypothetical protein
MCFLYGNKDLIILLSRAQQLVAILTKKTEAGIFKNFIAIAFKKISYPLSTISYPYQQLVTPHPKETTKNDMCFLYGNKDLIILLSRASTSIVLSLFCGIN